MTIKKIEVTEVSVNELTEQISDKLLGKLKSYLKDKQFEETDVFVTRQEAADFFSINLSTLWNWTRKGKVKCYAIGCRRYYNKKELIQVLKQNVLVFK